MTQDRADPSLVYARCNSGVEPAHVGQACCGWLMLQLAHPNATGLCPSPFRDETIAGQETV